MQNHHKSVGLHVVHTNHSLQFRAFYDNDCVGTDHIYFYYTIIKLLLSNFSLKIFKFAITLSWIVHEHTVGLHKRTNSVQLVNRFMGVESFQYIV